MARIAALGYHDVTDDPRDSGLQRPRALLYKHTRAAFREHLAAIHATGRAPALVTAIDLVASGDHLLLTFDDGGRSALDIGDELARYGWRGHFFVTTSLIGRPGFLEAADVRALHAAGHVVGSHAHRHRDVFSAQSLESMVDEWRTSCQRLADLTGDACVAASVPGGQISDAVTASARKVDLRYLFTSEPALAPIEADGCHVIGRVCIKSYTTTSRVRALARQRSWGRARVEHGLVAAARHLLPAVYRTCLQTYARRKGYAPPPLVGREFDLDDQ